MSQTFLTLIFCFSKGWINQFLSWEAFEPFARLSYNIYLVHMTVMFILIGKEDFTESISDLLMVSYIIRTLSKLMTSRFEGGGQKYFIRRIHEIFKLNRNVTVGTKY